MYRAKVQDSNTVLSLFELYNDTGVNRVRDELGYAYIEYNDFVFLLFVLNHFQVSLAMVSK